MRVACSGLFFVFCFKKFHDSDLKKQDLIMCRALPKDSHLIIYCHRLLKLNSRLDCDLLILPLGDNLFFTEEENENT